MTKPTVSVVVTCFNLGHYLDEAIDSIFAQTFQDFEIVVVDDGSTDAATVSRLSRISRPRTRVIHIDNRGLPGARNEGIRQSSGRFLCSLDADDRLEPTWLEKAVTFLNSHPHITFVSHWLRTFGEETSDWTPERCDLEALLTVNTVNGAALVRREAMDQVGGYDESLVNGCEDWDLWITMVERGYVGAIIPEVLFFYRRRWDSMSRAMSVGDRPHRLFETLIRKHEASYRRHMASLIAGWERDLATGRREVEKHRLEQTASLVPELSRSRRRLLAVRAKVDRVRRELEEAPAAESLRRAVEAERARLAVMEAETSRLHRDIASVHASLTWRLTKPVRAVVGWLRHPGKPA